MKKLYLSIFAFAIALTLIGCQSPLAKMLYKYEKNKIIDIIKNANDAKQLTSSIQMNVESTGEEGESTSNLEYAGYTNKDTAEMSGNVKITSSSQDQPENTDYKGITSTVVVKADDGLYLDPKLIKQDDSEIDIIKDGKFLHLTEDSMDDIATLTGSEVTEEDRENMKNTIPDIQDATTVYLSALAEDMKIVNKLDHTYEIEIPKEKFISHTEKYYETIQNIYEDTLGSVEASTSLGDSMIEDVENDFENLNDTLKDDPILMEITLNEVETEIENANTTLNMEDDGETSTVEINLSLTKFNQEREQKMFTDQTQFLELDEITTAAEAGNLSDLLNPEFITAMGMTAADINTISSMYFKLMSGDIGGLDINSLLKMVPDNTEGLDPIDESELDEMQKQLDNLAPDLDADLNDLLEGIR